MKYNVFARPMFKRGGMSQGTGITSGLDTPRIGFVNGTGYPGNPINSVERFPGESDIYKRMKEPSIGKVPSTIEKATKAVGPTSDYKDALLDYWPYKEGDKFGNYDFWPTVPEGTQLDEEGRIIQKEKFSSKGPMGDPMWDRGEGIETVGTKKDYGPYTEGSALEGKATKSEEDILLDQLGDTSLGKGEKALMLADIIGTPGGMEGKTKKAIELMKGKVKSDRQLKKDIAKLRYLQSGKERIAGIEAGEQTTSMKDIKAKVANSIAIARQKGLVTTKDGITYYDGKTREQLEGAIYDKLLDAQKNTLRQTVVGKNQQAIVALRADIRKKRLKTKPDDEKGQAKIAALEAELDDLLNPPGIYAEGGRVNYAQGTPMQEPAIAATQTANANTTENTRPVNKLTFAELRNRLPKEITDDVVQILANSEEALQDFAYIQTQEDINKFNVKYGVNVILPPQA